MSELFNEDYLVLSESYRDTMNRIVLPWLKKKEETRIVSGFGEKPLYSVCYEADQPVGSVLIVHGFTENAFKYAELIWSLLHFRFSVIAYDQRGHGRSWRDEKVAIPSVTHVDHFSEYVEDLRIICETYRNRIRKPLFAFGHSMGGAVVSLFLEQYTGVFDAAVLSSPMIAPDLGCLPVPVASAIGKLARLLGKAKKNPFFLRPYSGPENFATSCATDPARFAWYDEIKAAHAEFQNNVPSYRWSEESIRVTSNILAPGRPENIPCPVLLFAADHDSSVLPGPQKELISRIPQGQYVFVPNSKHEIFRSENSVLFPWWHQVIAFYQEQLSDLSRPGGDLS